MKNLLYIMLLLIIASCRENEELPILNHDEIFITKLEPLDNLVGSESYEIAINTNKANYQLFLIEGAFRFQNGRVLRDDEIKLNEIRRINFSLKGENEEPNSYKISRIRVDYAVDDDENLSVRIDGKKQFQLSDSFASRTPFSKEALSFKTPFIIRRGGASAGDKENDNKYSLGILPCNDCKNTDLRALLHNKNFWRPALASYGNSLESLFKDKRYTTFSEPKFYLQDFDF